MYIAYCDDSGSHKSASFQVVATLIIEDRKFRYLEVLSGVISEKLLTEEKLENFDEFRAWDLYKGKGIFEGVDQDKRFETIRLLLDAVKREQLPIIYGAVDRNKLDSTVYSSANPLNICLDVCIRGIEDYMRKSLPRDLALIIIDKCDDQIMKECHSAFRDFRKRLNTVIFMPEQAWHLHDDIYFGSSKESIGIQLADLCAFFIRMHQQGNDLVAETFYEIIKDCIVYSRLIPDGEM